MRRSNTSETADPRRRELFRGAQVNERSESVSYARFGGSNSSYRDEVSDVPTRSHPKSGDRSKLGGKSGSDSNDRVNSGMKLGAKHDTGANSDDLSYEEEYGAGRGEYRDNSADYDSDSDYENAGGHQQQTLDEEDDEVDQIKQQIRFTKEQSLTSTENALRIASEAEETGRSTLLNLGVQSDRIANAERDLEMARVNQLHAEEKSRKLKRLNRSMFAVHIDKPWGRAARIEQEEARIRGRHEQERRELDANRQFAYQSQRRVDDALDGRTTSFNPFRRKGKDADREKASIMERSKYQFEADSEDDEIEKQIDHNLDLIGNAASRLNGLARATSLEVEHQNEKLVNLHDKSDALDSNMFLNTQRLHKI